MFINFALNPNIILVFGWVRQEGPSPTGFRESVAG